MEHQPEKRIQLAVARWNATKPETPAPPIMGDIDRVMRIVLTTGQWPLSIVQTAESLGFALPAAQTAEVESVVFGLFQRRMELHHNKNDWDNPDLEEKLVPMSDEERSRQNPEQVTIVSPQVNQELGYPYMVRHQSIAWWVNGERRNRYVPAGMGVLFFRDIKEIEVTLEPLPPRPTDAKMWSWKEYNTWRTIELAKIPKKTVTVICEYGSRRCQEGDPVIDPEGNIVRRRWAGEWIREIIAYLPGMPSPYFFDDFTGHPLPTHSYSAREFRQEVADVAFVLMHQ